MVETEKIGILDCFVGLRKICESDKTSKNPKQEKQIAKAGKIADKIAESVYAKTAEAQLKAEASRSIGLEKYNKRNIAREKNKMQAESQEMEHENSEEMEHE